MKKTGLLLIGAVAIMAVSFTYMNKLTQKENAEITRTTAYTLDTEASVLSWRGEKNAQHFHTGSVKFSDGSINASDGGIDSGSFTVDMMSISVGDKMEEGKIDYLVQHLQSADFFNATDFPTVGVTVSGYKNGKLATTLNVLGQSITQDIPVQVEFSKTGVSIKGDFDIDFHDLKLPGMQTDPESGEAISSVINYKLDLVLLP
jgi:polyisoprenoid-binding protein YceI